METIVTSLLIAAIVAIPVQRAIPQEKPPEKDWLLALCVVAVAGAAATAVYIASRSCKPKYYWLCDGEQPPKYWVGTATKKECEINGWRRVGGPYDKPGDAPPQPPSTLLSYTEEPPGPSMRIKVHESSDMQHWTVIHEAVCPTEDFAYFPTNTAKAQMFYRLEMGAP